jgi:hypothetical protein
MQNVIADQPTTRPAFSTLVRAELAETRRREVLPLANLYEAVGLLREKMEDIRWGVAHYARTGHKPATPTMLRELVRLAVLAQVAAEDCCAHANNGKSPVGARSDHE